VVNFTDLCNKAVCYFDFPEKEQLFFIVIYGKNEQENISEGDKAIFKKLIEKIKKL